MAAAVASEVASARRFEIHIAPPSVATGATPGLDGTHAPGVGRAADAPTRPSFPPVSRARIAPTSRTPRFIPLTREHRAFMGSEGLMPEPVVLGVLAAPGLAHEIEESLSDALRERHPGVDWRVEVTDESADATDVGELKEAAREQMRERGWEMSVVLTDLPLLSGRRPVTAHASAQHRVAVVSVPALGAVNLEQRVVDAVVNAVEGILGERVGRRGGRRGRRARMAARLRELSSPLGAARYRDEGTVRFTTAVVRGNLRLLAGMVRANNPSLVVVR